MPGARTRLDGTTLVIRIPMRFQRRGGRKRIVAPDGSAIVPALKPQPDGTLSKALARAWRWQQQLDEGAYSSVSDIGEAEGISKSYVSRILRLTLLAPDIIETILGGGADYALTLETLERPLPASWDEQRAALRAGITQTLEGHCTSPRRRQDACRSSAMTSPHLRPRQGA